MTLNSRPMANVVIIEDQWNEDIQKVAKQFNRFAQKGSMRMIGFLIDKLFDIVSDDDDIKRVDAAILLQRIRAVNSRMVSSYISTLIDSIVGKSYFESDEFVTPNYQQFPVSNNPRKERIYIIEDEVEKEEVEGEGLETDVDDDSEISTSETEEKPEGDFMSELVSWDMQELIKFNILKNLKRISFKQIKSPIKKCASGDGMFEKDDQDIWACMGCETAYHVNCAKIVALFEGKCRICGEIFIIDQSQESP